MQVWEEETHASYPKVLPPLPTGTLCPYYQGNSKIHIENDY